MGVWARVCRQQGGELQGEQRVSAPRLWAQSSGQGVGGCRQGVTATPAGIGQSRGGAAEGWGPVSCSKGLWAGVCRHSGGGCRHEIAGRVQGASGPELHTQGFRKGSYARELQAGCTGMGIQAEDCKWGP